MKRKSNSSPSLVGTLAQMYMPLGEAEELAKGAKADLKRLTKAVNPRSKRLGKRNPDEAEDLYESFHQKKPDQLKAVVEEDKFRSKLTELGDLVSLVVKTPTGFTATIEFEQDAPILCSSPDGRQLYIVGGDQRVDLAAIEMHRDPWLKDTMTLGVLTKTTYRTQKGFHDYKTVDYYHRLGEETGAKPVLLYDTINRRLSIAGGQYLVKHEGITN